MKTKTCIKVVNCVLMLISFYLTFTVSVFSHPGRTAKDGCHYCWTNCYKWGVPYGKRHCHWRYKGKDDETLTKLLRKIDRTTNTGQLALLMAPECQ